MMTDRLDDAMMAQMMLAYEISATPTLLFHDIHFARLNVEKICLMGSASGIWIQNRGRECILQTPPAGTAYVSVNKQSRLM